MSLSQLSHLIMVGRVIPGAPPTLAAARGVATVARTTGQPVGSFLVTPDDTTGGLNDGDCTPTATLYGAGIAVATIKTEIVTDAGVKKLRVDMFDAANALVDASFTFAVQRIN